MPVFELQSPDGRSFQVEAADINSAASAFTSHMQGKGKEPPASGDTLGGNIAKAWDNPPKGLSLIGMLKNAWEAAKAPGDAYSGKLQVFDPETGHISDEALKRSIDSTAITPLRTAPGGIVAAPRTPALSTLAERQAAKAAQTVPSIAELKAAATKGYESPEVAAVQIRPEALPQLSEKIQRTLNEAGIDENVAPQTFGILSKAATMPEEAVAVTAKNLQSLRRTLGNAAGSIDKTERLAAVRAKNDIDDFLANLPEGAIISGDGKAASEILKEANVNYGAAERASILDRTQVRAELRAAAANSGQNVTNTIRQRLADILINPKLHRGFSEAELAQMERLVRGTTTENVIRGTGKLMGGGGGLGAVVAGSIGHMAAGWLGVAVPVIGYGLTKLSNAMTAGQMSRLNIAVRANSPLGRQIKAPMRDWSEAAQEFELNPSFRAFARLTVASRNLSNNLRDIGISIEPEKILRSLQGPMQAGAENEQPQPPGAIDQQPSP